MLGGIIRGGTALGKAVTSGASRKTMTKAEKAIVESLKKKGYNMPNPPKPNPNVRVTFKRREIK
jgi:hypothetical protein